MEKIIAHHAVGLHSIKDIRIGGIFAIKAEWTMSSELTWISMDKFSQRLFRHESRQGRDLKVTPEQFCIIRHIGGIVAFAAIPFWWIFGHF